MKTKKIMAKSQLLYQCRKQLLAGRRLNTYQFDKETGSQRLAALIHYLTSETYRFQWPIKRRKVSRLNPCTGKPRMIMSYWLEPEDIEQLKKKPK